MNTRIYSDFKEFPASYYDAFKTDEYVSDFDQTVEWYKLFNEFIVTDEEDLKIIVLEDSGDNSPLLIFPLISKKLSPPFDSYTSIESASNYYTSCYRPIIKNGVDVVSCVDSVFKAINALNGKWYALDLNPVDMEFPFFTELEKAFTRNDCYAYSYYRFGNWYLEVNGRSFDEYYSSLSSRLKNTIKRKEKKLVKEHVVKIQIVEQVDELDKAIQDYENIYNSSWKKPEPYDLFIREVVENYAKQGQLRLGMVYVDDRPAAAQIWFINNGTASIFKLAYDPDFGAYSVGSILTKALMHHAIDVDKVAIIDYLCGDDQYKQDWMSHRRERKGLRAYNTATLPGNIKKYSEIIKSTVKRFMKDGNSRRNTR